MWLGSQCFWLHICRHSCALMCCGRVWIKTLNCAGLPYYKLPCQEIILTGICERFWCVCMWVMRWCRATVWSTLALCVQCVLARRVFMSPGCSQCGEEGCSVHGRRAGRQSGQSSGEPAGQRRYSDGYWTFCPHYLVPKSCLIMQRKVS